ncbi:hypothetical protein GY45DRAFT_938585 [Cubamyces sp. BRFM 1775]|nr:hypothetical protein GY45DRAFT_938585 [Cubamyces sp. BRFM 1775]
MFSCLFCSGFQACAYALDSRAKRDASSDPTGQDCRIRVVPLFMHLELPWQPTSARVESLGGTDAQANWSLCMEIRRASYDQGGFLGRVRPAPPEKPRRFSGDASGCLVHIVAVITGPKAGPALRINEDAFLLLQTPAPVDHYLANLQVLPLRSPCLAQALQAISALYGLAPLRFQHTALRAGPLLSSISLTGLALTLMLATLPLLGCPRIPRPSTLCPLTVCPLRLLPP